MERRALFALSVWSCALLHLLVASASAAEAKLKGAKYLEEAYLRKLNDTKKTWKSGRNFAENTPDYEMKRLYGSSRNLMNARSLKPFEEEPEKVVGRSGGAVLFPKHFDAREQWEDCNDTISYVPDTGLCASHWAASVTSALSDRICIHTGAERAKIQLSIDHLLQCCKTCGLGCKGGYAFQTWKNIELSGIVTEECQPYRVTTGCNFLEYPNKCTKSKPPKQNCPEPDNKCVGDRNKVSKNFKYTVDLVRALPNADEFTQAYTTEFIKQDLINNGPVTATMRLYADFFSYKSGIYSPTPNAKKLDDVTLRIIGWGEKRHIEYWIGIVPWGKNFGDGGFVKIRTGVAALQIDRRMHAGIPQFA